MAKEPAGGPYSGEGLLEEEQTIEERVAPARTVLDSDILQEPIRALPHAQPLSVTLETSVVEAVRLMQEHHVGCVLVQAEGRLVGIFTERDVLNKMVGSRRSPSRTKVSAVMTSDPETLKVDNPIAFALNLMSEGGFRHLPLVDDVGRPVGVLSVKNIVSYLAEFFSREVRNLPPRPHLLNPGQVESG